MGGVLAAAGVDIVAESRLAEAAQFIELSTSAGPVRASVTRRVADAANGTRIFVPRRRYPSSVDSPVVWTSRHFMGATGLTPAPDAR